MKNIILNLFNFQIYVLDIYLNKDTAFGFEVFHFENEKFQASFIGLAYDTFNDCLFISVLFFNFKIQF